MTSIRARLDRLEQGDDDWTLWRNCPECGELVRNDTIADCTAHLVAPPESERRGWITLKWRGSTSEPQESGQD